MKLSQIFSNLLIVVIVLFYGCTTTFFYTKSANDIKSCSITFTVPIPLKDVIGVYDQQEIFERNLFIGHIKFSGGFIVNKDKGSRVQSKYVTFSKEEEYLENATSKLLGILNDVLISKKYIPKHADVSFELDLKREDILNLKVNKNYKKEDYKDYGTDNINLPTYMYSLEGIQKDKAERLGRQLNADHLLVPVIENYYSHTAGWFNEQYSGCGAGVRISFHIYIFDLNSGDLIFQFIDSVKTIEPYESVLSSLQILQRFEELEAKIHKHLMRIFPT